MKIKYFTLGFVVCLILVLGVTFGGYQYLKKERSKVLLEENSKEITELDYSIFKINKKDLLDLNLSDIKNNPINLESNDYIFINYWATWCMPCIAELPSINSLRNSLVSSSTPIRFLFASNEKIDKVIRFEEKKNYEFEYVFFNKDRTSSKFINDLIPTSYIIDKKNMICYKITGSANYNSEILKSFFNSIINKK